MAMQSNADLGRQLAVSLLEERLKADGLLRQFEDRRKQGQSAGSDSCVLVQYHGGPPFRSSRPLLTILRLAGSA